MAFFDIKKLHYEIYKYSSFSTNYLPENILEDCPNNPNSRWSSNTNRPPQYLTLKLQRPGIVKQIKFGKYEKNHVCNLRKFKIFGGLEEERLVLLFEGGLKNNSTPETFNIRHKTESGELLPIMYIQIMPLLSWGPSFNFSVWYVEVLGQDDPIFVRTTAENSFRNFNTLREVEIIRLCLKHFRLQGYDKAYEALQEQTNVQLEHSMISELHEILVNNGDFDKTEKFMEKCIEDGLLDNYLLQQDYKATWELQDSITQTTCSKIQEVASNSGLTAINPTLDDYEGGPSSSECISFSQRQSNCYNSVLRPGMRGGHQLVIDSERGLMYLFGGWDGYEDLSDLWLYDIKLKQWSLIHERSDKRDGPTPRSCHKMVYDPINSQIFTLGRYLDQSSRTREVIKSDFYLYDTNTSTWLQICDDTSQLGGPQLIFDHQMCIDVEKRTIYVFGGRILTPRNTDELTTEYQYSGLFSYHIDTNTWTQILVDCGHPSASNPDVESIKSRVTHSMLFHHKHRKLYIFGGQRNKEHTKEFISFNVDTNDIAVLNSGISTSSDSMNEPQSGFTQRATIDCDRDEIYVLSSLSKDKERRDLNVNSFWLYSLKANEWKIVYKNDHSSECHVKHQNMCSEPCPRYAHQLVYDTLNKVHYLFGGNPGKKSSISHLRLDDFWILYLEKPSRAQILRHCKYLIRRLKYKEITKKNPLEAVQYLQTKLFEIIDHNDPVQLKEFHKLASLLFICDNENPQLTNATSNSNIAGSCLPHATEEGNASDVVMSNDVQHQSLKLCPDLENDSMDSTISSQTSSISLSLNQSVNTYNSCINKPNEHLYQMKNRRNLLFNKLVEFLPENLVQPKSNLSDLILY